MTKTQVGRTSRGLSRQQLVVHAREMGRHFQKERELQRMLSQRDRQVRDMATASLAAQEEERQWIAFEVHDRIAQTLASAFQQLQALESMTRPDSPAGKVVVRIRMLLREAIRESRNIMNELHPPLLDEYGVVPLVKEELRRYAEETGIRVKLDVAYPERPARPVEMAIYRIFHEALVNVRRHAPGARKVSVGLASGDGGITLQVQDDGPGFDVEAATVEKRVGGLLSMRRRAEIIGGALAVTSRPGQGTTVALRVPVSGTQSKEEDEG